MIKARSLRIVERSPHHQEVDKIKARTKEALERAYISLQGIVADLYVEADNAVDADDYNDASLLQSQADRLYQTAENLEIIIAEQEE
jgi:hypothetical protein